MIHKVINADRVKGTYKLHLKFRNGERKVFDAKDYVGGKKYKNNSIKS